MSRVPIMSGLYDIKAEPVVKFDMRKKEPRSGFTFSASLHFDGVPGPQEIIDVLKLLRPDTDFNPETVQVKYLKDIQIN